VHLGARMEIGELVFTDETRRLEDAALWSKVRDIIDATFDERLLKQTIAKMQATKTFVLEKPQDAVDVVSKDLALSQDKARSLLMYFGRESGTLFGLVQGITRLAQDFPENVDRQIELERYAGAIVSKPEAYKGAVRVVA
jgi:hypothetical protein